MNMSDTYSDSSTSQSDEALLNYSLVDTNVDGEQIKLKLKVSKTQPKVILKALDQNIINNKRAMNSSDCKEAHAKDQSDRRRSCRLLKMNSASTARRSSRILPKVSYAGCVSSADEDYFVDESMHTPRKKPYLMSSKAMEDLCSPSKLGFEHIAISSPSMNKRAIKQQLKETPSKVKSPSCKSKLFKAMEADIKDDKLPSVVSINTKVTSTPQKAKPPSRNFTPTMENRKINVLKPCTPLNIVKENLHVACVPMALPCREKEYMDVYSFLEGKLLDGCGGCIYISGVPGTGKTATVTAVINQLQASIKKHTVPPFTYISINGMHLTEPRQAYVEILRQLTGKTSTWEHAQSTLEEKFTKTKQIKTPVILLVDELDILCTKRQQVVYNIFDWPTKARAQLIVVTIANTMDLPERLLMGRVTSRLGLTRLTFQAYTHKQLQEIVTKRLMSTDAFNPDALQLVARKVASVSGDARRALDICRRAAEVAEMEGADVLVSMQHVNVALNSMITQSKVQVIRSCSRLQQLVLQAIAAEGERIGVDEVTFANTYKMLASLAAIDGFRMTSVSIALSAVKYLTACRLVLSDPRTSDFNQRLILNINKDDIYYALHDG